MQTAAVQPSRRPAPRRLLEESTLRVYSDLPCGTNPADASIADGLSYTALAATLSGERAASVELHAVALHRLLEEQETTAWIYRFGLAGFTHAAVLALSDEGPIFLDAFTGIVLQEPIWSSLDRLSQGKAVRSAPLGRARKTCCLDPAVETPEVVELIAQNAERELVGENRRVFSIAWRPDIYMATQPAAETATAILGRLGVPRQFLQLLLYPLSVQEDDKLFLWLDDMPVIGAWFVGEDLPKGRTPPPHRRASRDRMALATTLAEQRQASLDFKEMQERSVVTAQVREELARLQALADSEQRRTAEWRDRATVAETALAEVRQEVARLSEAQWAARQDALRLEQDRAEWREHAVVSDTSLTEAREQIARLSEAQSAAHEDALRLEHDKAEWRERAVASDGALAEAREQIARLSEAQSAASEDALRLEHDKAEWRERAVASDGALAELREQVARLNEARTAALEDARCLELGKAEWRERATMAETLLAEVRAQAERLSLQEVAAREEILRLEQRAIQLRAEVDEADVARAVEAARAEVLQAKTEAAEQDIAQLSRELKLTRGRAVRALASAAEEAAVLGDRLVDAEARLAATEADLNALREAAYVDGERRSEEVSAALRRVEEARTEVAKERQARQETEWSLHDSRRRIQVLQTELAQERGGRELDLVRVEAGRRLAFEAQTRLEREAEALRRALLNAPRVPAGPSLPPPSGELAQLRAELAAVADERNAAQAALETARETARHAQTIVAADLAAIAQERDAVQAAADAAFDARNALLAEAAAAARDRDAAQAALEVQIAIVARSRYMRLRSGLLRLFARGASAKTQPQA